MAGEAIRFGTDGWRAVIGEGFTFANLERVAQATAAVWRRAAPSGEGGRVVVGFDRRFLSDQFAVRTAEILAGNGFRVTLASEPCPTQAVSLAVKASGAVGGVMITASHNPPAFNGFKLKADYGGSADPELCRRIEASVDSEPVRACSLTDGLRGRTVVRRDLVRPHLDAIRKLVNFRAVADSGLRFAHDALYGVGAGAFDVLLAGTRCRVSTRHAEHNPAFGGLNPEPIPANYGETSAWLRRHPHDVCLVTDGDADRVGSMDGRGGPLSTHQIICLLIRHLVRNRGERGRIVKALTTTSMVDKMCDAWGLELVETGVGFKYICAEMLRGDVLLGAEESGGIGFAGHIPERDGLLAGLMLLEMLALEGRKIEALCRSLEKEFGPHAYSRVDTHYPLEKREALIESCRQDPPARLLRSPVERVRADDGVKFIARDGSWLMLRGSGTEPILRVYAESRDEASAQSLVRQGLRLLKREV